MFVSVTRIRLRSLRFLVPLLWNTHRVNKQIRAAEGCIESDVRGGPDKVFWTKSLWRDEAAMQAFMASGAHLKAMPSLKHWCDEASVAHWTEERDDLGWPEALRGMARYGRTSKVLHPSPAHAAGSPLGTK